MKVLVVGGGPAGLFFAYLLKKRQPRHEIVVVDQNLEGATYGWGVVFSGVALNTLQAADEEFFRAFISGQQQSDYIEITHRSVATAVRGNIFSRSSRLDLLAKLLKACRGVGVKVNYGCRVEPDGVDGTWDIVVAADGLNSAFRDRFSSAFGCRVTTRRNKFAWYGTTALFHPLSLIFRSTEWGTFIAHCYRFKSDMSTFLVECSPQTWQRAGLEHKSDEESRAFCAAIFHEDLKGAKLLSNRSDWFIAEIVSNERSVHGRYALIGDAYRTVHFSLGSGTRMAMQDAVALCQAVESAEDNSAQALKCFDQSRKPASVEFQEAARRSLDWYETVDNKLSLSPVAFTFDYMTRTGKVGLEELRKMDPDFARAVEREATQTCDLA